MTTKKTLITAALCLTPWLTEAAPQANPKQALPTAQQQMLGSDADTEVTRQTRQKLVNDTTLSVASRNVTIVTLGQKMTLQGMVPSQAEKNRVVDLAKSVSPAVQVIDQLTITKQ